MKISSLLILLATITLSLSTTASAFAEQIAVKCPACGYQYSLLADPSAGTIQAKCPACGYVHDKTVGHGVGSSGAVSPDSRGASPPSNNPQPAGQPRTTTLAILPLSGEVTQGQGGGQPQMLVPGSNLPLYLPGSGNYPGYNPVANAVGDLREEVYQRVTAAFFKTRRFQVVERGQLARVLQEARLQQTMLFDERTAVRLGQLTGARQVVIGAYRATAEHRSGISLNQRVDFYPLKLSLNLRVVDVATGRVADVFNVDAAGSHAHLSTALAELLDDVSAKLDREVANNYRAQGYVIRVIDPERLLIDLGTNAGIARGDRFLVYERAGDVVHPVTGQVIGAPSIPQGEIRVESVDRDSAVAEVVDGEGQIGVGMSIVGKPRKAGLFEVIGDVFNR